MHTDLDTLATALYVKIDDEVKAGPDITRRRPPVGITPKITDAELITLSVLEPLLGYHNQARWAPLRPQEPSPPVPGIPKQPGYIIGTPASRSCAHSTRTTTDLLE